MDGKPNRRNKAAFLNFSSMAWTLPLTIIILGPCDFFVKKKSTEKYYPTLKEKLER